MKRVFLGASLVLGSLLLAACGAKSPESQKTDEDKIQAVATFYPMYEFTKEVLGDEGAVELLIPAGTEPHDYEPSAQDLAKISDADVFVYNSENFETWVENIEDSLSDKNLVIEAADEIELLSFATTDSEVTAEEAEDDHDHDHEGQDPHVWTDPVMAQKEVAEIAKELSERYPEKKATFEKNAAAYTEKLAALDQSYQKAFANAKNKTFLVQHAAFGYLAHQYGLTQKSIAGVSPDQEPTPGRLAELKQFAEEQQVDVIYFEENANSKVAETLATETGIKLMVLNPLESLTNEQIKAGETYLTVMEENLTALKASIK